MPDTFSEYWESVHAIVEEGHTLPEDDRHDFVHESVDGNYWVIYTHAARKCLEYSDNEHVLFDELGPQTVEDYGTLYTRGAYFAMLADVNEAMAELDDE